MVHMKRGDRKITVMENAVDSYRKQGYRIIDQRGRDAEPKEPITYEEAMKRIAEQDAYMTALRKTLAEKEGQIAALEYQIKQMQRTADDVKMQKKRGKHE